MRPAIAPTPPATAERGRFRSHPLLLDMGLTGGAQVSLFVSNLLLISLFARFLGATEVAEYLLLRRVVTWLQSAVQMGLHVGIPRYVAYESGIAEGKREPYFVVGIGWLALIAVSLGLILNLWRGGFSRLMFGNRHLAYLILPVSLTVLGLVLHTAVYGYFRGQLQMNRANMLQIWDMAIVPVVSLLLLVRSRSVANIVNLTGLVMIVTAVAVSFPPVRRALRDGHLELRRRLKELLRYGLARVPGDFGAAALFVIGPMIAAQLMPLSQVSPLLLGSSVLAAAAVSITPLGVLLLSKVSVVVAQNRLEDLRLPLSHMMNGVLELSLFMALQFIVLADVILKIWVGSGLLNAVPIVRITALAIPCYLFYAALRSVIDAVTIKASNAHNILISLLVFLILTGLSVLVIPRAYLLISLSVSMVMTFAVLAALTAVTVRRLCQVKLSGRSFIQSLFMNLLFFAIAITLRAVAGSGRNPVAYIVIESLVCMIYLYTLVKLRPEWLRFVWEKGFRRAPQYSV